MRRGQGALKPTTIALLLLLGITLAAWGLRGIGLLTFIPGGLLWILIFATISAGVVDMVQKTRRW